MVEPSGSGITRKLVDSLYTEALLLSDELRDCFGVGGVADAAHLDPTLRVALACEALKGTTRLMMVIAWLLDHRGALDRGAGTAGIRLGVAAETAPGLLLQLPEGARMALAATIELYQRVSRLDQGAITLSGGGEAGARALLERLERAF